MSEWDLLGPHAHSWVMSSVFQIGKILPRISHPLPSVMALYRNDRNLTFWSPDFWAQRTRGGHGLVICNRRFRQRVAATIRWSSRLIARRDQRTRISWSDGQDFFYQLLCNRLRLSETWWNVVKRVRFNAERGTAIAKVPEIIVLPCIPCLESFFSVLNVAAKFDLYLFSSRQHFHIPRSTIDVHWNSMRVD